MKKYKYVVELQTENRWNQSVTVEAFCWNGAAQKAEKQLANVTNVYRVTRKSEVKS